MSPDRDTSGCFRFASISPPLARSYEHLVTRASCGQRQLPKFLVFQRVFVASRNTLILLSTSACFLHKMWQLPAGPIIELSLLERL
jgi:hypothetical protein